MEQAGNDGNEQQWQSQMTREPLEIECVGMTMLGHDSDQN